MGSLTLGPRLRFLWANGYILKKPAGNKFDPHVFMNLSFLRDRVFFRDMLALAIPVAFQQFITASLSMIDVLMVGQLGETSVAALGLANQIFFLLILFLFGVTSGMAIFTAQYWGKGDVENIRKVLGICLAPV